MDKIKIYTIIFWISWTVTLIWVILKAAGIINTPELVKSIPLAGVIFAGGTMFQILKTTNEGVKENKTEIREIKTEIRKTDKDINKLDEKLSKEIHNIDKRMIKIETKLV